MVDDQSIDISAALIELNQRLSDAEDAIKAADEARAPGKCAQAERLAEVVRAMIKAGWIPMSRAVVAHYGACDLIRARGDALFVLRDQEPEANGNVRLLFWLFVCVFAIPGLTAALAGMREPALGSFAAAASWFLLRPVFYRRVRYTPADIPVLAAAVRFGLTQIEERQKELAEQADPDPHGVTSLLSSLATANLGQVPGKSSAASPEFPDL